MWSYILKRLLLMIPTLFGILLITFVVIQFVPGGPVEQMIAQFARFDLGKSFFHNKDVGQLVLEKLPVSISLGIWTFLLVYLISVPLGIAKAVRAGAPFDTVTTFIVLLGYAIPSFVMGVVLLVFFAGGSFVQWFPLRGITSINWGEMNLFHKVLDYFWHIALPVISM